MKLERTSNSLILHQDQYIKRKLSKFNFTEFPPSTCPIDPKLHLQKATSDELTQFAALGVNYQALVGSLNYLAILTRPDIAYSVSKLSQFLERPGISHFRAAVQVFRYLHHTKSLGLLFSTGGSEPLIISVNADWGNCPDTCQSHTNVKHLQVQAVLSLGIRNLKGPSAGGIMARPGLVDRICNEGVICWMMTPSSQILSTSPGRAMIPPALGPLRFLMPSDKTACTSRSHSHS
ncbi:hypothetical protein PCANC_05677 [Puccinia coronata f. sp. avenae]|nr:hypothetical protein PCANC_05677 [Puccinia coronata f. sp. avenae]